MQPTRKFVRSSLIMKAAKILWHEIDGALKDAGGETFGSLNDRLDSKGTIGQGNRNLSHATFYLLKFFVMCLA